MISLKKVEVETEIDIQAELDVLEAYDRLSESDSDDDFLAMLDHFEELLSDDSDYSLGYLPWKLLVSKSRLP